MRDVARFMAWSTALLLCVAVLPGCESEATEVCSGDSGAAIYADFCASCHGDDKQGWASDDKKKGPGLAGDGLKQWWAKLTREGVAGRYGAESKMISIGSDALEDEELTDVLGWILDGDKAGQKLYVSACGQCHGINASKGGSGPALSGDGLVDQWMNATLHRPTPTDVLPMPEFPLCEDDLRAVVEYLRE